jgi:putative holliday junction resolvase
MTKGKYLGIDFGDKRVGIAVSDFNKEIAFPRDFLEYESSNWLIDRISRICEEDQVVKIILGLPVNMDGTFGERALKTMEFFNKLKEAIPGVSIECFDERLSTEYAVKALHAQGIKSKNQKGKRDALSAQIVLQNYLNSLKNI